jgi:hypothetical protein
MANIEFHDLQPADLLSLSTSDVLAIQIYNQTLGWLTKKITSAQLGLYINNEVFYNDDLETTAKQIIAAINELNALKDAANVTYDDQQDLSVTDIIDSILSRLDADEDDIEALQNDVYQPNDTVSLQTSVFATFINDVIRITIPLQKGISVEVDSISVSGDFIIPGILADDDLSTLGTVDVAAADDIGVNITITPLNTLTLEGTVTLGSTDALLTFNAAPTPPEPESEPEPNEEPEEPEEEPNNA